MTIKTPLPDEVFADWLQTKNKNDIEKAFGRKPAEISPMEVVGREIQKSPALLYRSLMQEASKSKEDKKQYSYRDLTREKFYRFSEHVKPEDWKEKNNMVKLYSKVEEKKCSKCAGHGFETCKNCSGTGVVACDNCKDTSNLHCRECKNGKQEVEIQLYDQHGKIEKVKREIICPNCHGEWQQICKDCAGTKQVLCNKCKGEYGKACKDCEGTGVVYLFPDNVVPFAKSLQANFFFNESLEKEMSKAKVLQKINLNEMLEQKSVEPIRVNKLKDLEQKKLEELLGFWDKDANKQVKNCKKSFEEKDKSRVEEPKLPIEVYPLQKIEIDTSNASGYKKTKFAIYSIGSANGYVLFDIGF